MLNEVGVPPLALALGGGSLLHYMHRRNNAPISLGVDLGSGTK
jgi:hypothetical protein